MVNILERGLTPDEHLRHHGQLDGNIAERLVDQHQLLLAVANCAQRVLPACRWVSGHMTPSDRAHVDALEAALTVAQQA
jgi:hypothetical protein